MLISDCDIFILLATVVTIERKRAADVNDGLTESESHGELLTTKLGIIVSVILGSDIGCNTEKQPRGNVGVGVKEVCFCGAYERD